MIRVSDAAEKFSKVRRGDFFNVIRRLKIGKLKRAAFPFPCILQVPGSAALSFCGSCRDRIIGGSAKCPVRLYRWSKSSGFLTSAFQRNRNRAVVEKADFHVCAELAGFHVDIQFGEFFYKIFVKRAGGLWGGRCCETRPVSFSAVGI